MAYAYEDDFEKPGYPIDGPPYYLGPPQYFEEPGSITNAKIGGYGDSYIGRGIDFMPKIGISKFAPTGTSKPIPGDPAVSTAAPPQRSMLPLLIGGLMLYALLGSDGKSK